MAISTWVRARFGLDVAFPARLLGFLVAGSAVFLCGLPEHHPFRSLGAANKVTLMRAVMVVFLAALTLERHDTQMQWLVLVLATLVALADAADGWLARRTNMVSAFGARFDMETDAFFILVLSIWAWETHKAGAWVLASGLMRYAFVLSGRVFPVLRTPLPPSWRRKAIAAAQMTALLIAIAPFVPVSVSAPVAATALVALTYSFLSDIGWILRHSARAPTFDSIT